MLNIKNVIKNLNKAFTVGVNHDQDTTFVYCEHFALSINKAIYENDIKPFINKEVNESLSNENSTINYLKDRFNSETYENCFDAKSSLFYFTSNNKNVHLLNADRTFANIIDEKFFKMLDLKALKKEGLLKVHHSGKQGIIAEGYYKYECVKMLIMPIYQKDAEEINLKVI